MWLGGPRGIVHDARPPDQQSSQQRIAFFNGRIDDIYVFDRVLSPSEIAVLAGEWAYQRPTLLPGTVTLPSPVATPASRSTVTTRLATQSVVGCR
jgi:hypothetical protein